jgi:hypothetical protein
MVTKLSHCARLLVLKLAFESVKQKLLLQTDTHTHDSVILTRNGDDAHDPLPYFTELTNGVPLDLLLNQSSDKKKGTPALVVAKTLSFETCREHGAHS